jgi:uncharacterized integral membrane protein
VTGRIEVLYRAVHGYRRAVALLIYALITVAAYAFAYLLRFEFAVPTEYAQLFAWTVGPLLTVRVVTLRLFRLTRERWRYASIRDVVRLAS